MVVLDVRARGRKLRYVGVTGAQRVKEARKASKERKGGIFVLVCFEVVLALRKHRRPVRRDASYTSSSARRVVWIWKSAPSSLLFVVCRWIDEDLL